MNFKEKIFNAYKIYIKGTNMHPNKYKGWYSNKDQKTPNYMHDSIRELLLDSATRNSLEIKTSNLGEEETLYTEIHQKKIDIAIVDPELKKGEPGRIVVAISFKMPLQSVNKNVKNFGEANIGDTSLIKESGIPFFYICITDSHPIKSVDGKFDFENLSLNSFKVFTDVMKKDRSNKYRNDGIFIISVDFKDLEFKKSQKYLPFKTQEEKMILAEKHLEFLGKKTFKEIDAKVLLHSGQWIDNFESSLKLFKDLIEAEILLFKLRKKGL